MACLIKSKFTGRIVWIGRVPDQRPSIRSRGVDQANVDFSGISGEAHSGLTRSSCVRVTFLHPKGTEIRNSRQLSVLSLEENNAIATQLGLDDLKPEWLGASIVIKGIPDLSHLPPGSRLQTNNGTTLTVDLENEPCVWPGKEIDADYPGKGKLFKRAAVGRRGITAWVERPGSLEVGDEVSLFVPTQRAWAPVS